MADIWTFSDDVLDREIDLMGFSVQAVDGSIGKIDAARFEVGASYIIVDTGPWIFGKKVLLPAGVVRRIDVDSEAVFVDRSKDEIKNAPELDEYSDLVSGGSEYRLRVGAYYDRSEGRIVERGEPDVW
jgi:hypothetical protein